MKWPPLKLPHEVKGVCATAIQTGKKKNQNQQESRVLNRSNMNVNNNNDMSNNEPDEQALLCPGLNGNFKFKKSADGSVDKSVAVCKLCNKEPSVARLWGTSNTARQMKTNSMWSKENLEKSQSP